MKKEKITFTIKDEIIKLFKELTNKSFINRSALVESFIANWIESEKENNDKNV